MAITNTGSVDLESVLNVGRRTLSVIGEVASPRYHQPQYTDTIYLKREDNSNAIESVKSKIVIFGELQLLYSIFERYTSNINIYEDSPHSISPPSSAKPSFSVTLEEDEHEEGSLPIASTLRQTSLSSSKESSSPPPAVGNPSRKKVFSSSFRSQTIGSTVSEYSLPNLDGKRYGCITLPNMSIIEILEILLRTGLELVDVSSDYNENVLYQNFVLSKTRPTSQKFGQFHSSRSSSFTGT